MKQSSVFVVVLISLFCVPTSPAYVHGQPGANVNAVDQYHWPPGFVEVVRHPSLVYTEWFNADYETFYFNATLEEINDLLERYSKVRLRDHVVYIRSGQRKKNTLVSQPTSYNVSTGITDGNAVDVVKRRNPLAMFEPIMTITIDPDEDEDFYKTVTIPKNVIAKSQIPDCPLKSKLSKPTRKAYHSRIRFDDGTSATNRGAGLRTKIALWEEGIEKCIVLGKVNRKGKFIVALSDQEVADLKSGKAWMTLTSGNPAVKPKPDHPKLGVDKLVHLLRKAPIVEISRPKPWYGRMLFEDGSPAVFDPSPYPRHQASVRFSCIGACVKADGYFHVYLTDDQYAEELERYEEDSTRVNVCIPMLDSRGRMRDRERYVFSPKLLSKDKSKAGALKVPKPSYLHDGEDGTPAIEP